MEKEDVYPLSSVTGFNLSLHMGTSANYISRFVPKKATFQLNSNF